MRQYLHVTMHKSFCVYYGLEIYRHTLNLAQNYVKMYYLIGTDMKTLNNSNIIQLTDILQVLKIVIVIIVVYAILHLFTESICIILQHQSFIKNTSCADFQCIWYQVLTEQLTSDCKYCCLLLLIEYA